MAPFLSAIAVFVCGALAGNVQPDGSKGSVRQVRETLQNLLRSIEDGSTGAEALVQKRQQWCDSTLKVFDTASQVAGTSLRQMQTHLSEREAEASEEKGTVQQLQTDIEMVRHTIKQTEDMLKDSNQSNAKSLQALLQNKHLSLASKRGQLDVTIPVLAQVQGGAAEIKQRISYRTDSAGVAKEFLTVLKDQCQAGGDRADTQATARMGESNSIRATLQALEQIDETRSGSQDASLSFVQLTREMTTDDLADLFSDQQDRAVVVRHSHVSRRHRDRRSSRGVGDAAALKPHIQSLLSQLKTVDSASDQVQWCKKQQEESALALKLAQDSVHQLGGEIDAHIASEAELAEEISRLQKLTAAIADASKQAADFAKQEQAFIQSSQKDQALATRILTQLSTILKELGVADSAKGLESAQKTFDAQMKAAPKFLQEASDKADALVQKAQEFTQVQESELHNLEFARDDHTAQRQESAEHKRLYEADVQQAAVFVQKLQASCKSNTDAESQNQRLAQVHALQDADRALDGKLVEDQSSSNSLRGSDAKANHASKELTPMERAAAEMGVSVD